MTDISFFTFEPWQYLLVAAVAFGASILGGVAGYGTGLLLPPILIPLIGPEAVVPVIGVSALLTNASRVVAFRKDFNREMAIRVAVIAVPTTILGAYGYTLFSGPSIMVLIGAVLILLVFIRRILAKHKYQLSPRGVSVASVGYGLIVGGTAGSGVVLLSILLSAGLSGVAVIATDAGISITLGIIKSLTFAANGALGWGSICMALLIGVSALPGAFIAKALAYRMDGKLHILFLDAIVILGGSFLIYRGLAA